MRDVSSSPAHKPPDLLEERRIVLRSTDFIVFVLAGLFAIALIGVLWVAKALLMPIAAALIIGTMLSAGAGALERYRMPHALSVALMLIGSCGMVALVFILMSAPVLAWTSRLPELGPQLREKLHVFDRPLALWGHLMSTLGVSSPGTSLALPKIEWVQPTLEFLSPTLTEFVLFAVTLVLFTLSWPNLRRSLILTFQRRDARLRTLRMLNEMEERLGNYLLTVTIINSVVGILTGIIALIAGLPSPAALGALAFVLNYIPVIGPALVLVVLAITGILSAPTLGVALLAPVLFAGVVFLEGHFVTPSIIGRGLSLNALAVFFAFAFWTWLWGPMGAFLASPMLIIGIILREHLWPAEDGPQLPQE